MKKIIHILKAWGKALGLINISTAEKKMSDLRLKICEVCPFAQESSVLLVLNGDAKYENLLKCTKCGCPCVEKTLIVDEKCPLGKW